MVSLVNSKFEIVICFFIMDIGGPSGRGCSRKRTRGARTGQGAVMTNVPRGIVVV